MIKTPLSTVIGGAFWTPKATIVGGTSKTFDQIIKSLFANGERGFAYDPNDLSTMFQDAAGTIPVTGVEQTIGLLLDKSGLGHYALQTTSASKPIFRQKPILGSENVVNGDFSNGITAWDNVAVTAIVENGRARVTHTNGGGLYQDIVVTPHKTYEVSGKVENVSGATPSVFVYGSVAFTPILGISSGNSPLLYVVATSSVIRVYLYKAGSGECYWDDISVKEVKGYHTDQNYIEYDAIDDKLTTTLPTQLTGCTVVRAVPNVGTQILTGQTIPTTYNNNTDHCGLIVINRALTPSETSAIAAEFNKRAGV